MFFASNAGVTLYWHEPGDKELQIAYLSYSDIVTIEVAPSTELEEPVLVKLIKDEEAWMQFGLPSANGDSERFLNEVRRRMELPPEQNTHGGESVATVTNIGWKLDA